MLSLLWGTCREPSDMGSVPESTACEVLHSTRLLQNCGVCAQPDHADALDRVFCAQDPEGHSLWDLTWYKAHIISANLTPGLLADTRLVLNMPIAPGDAARLHGAQHSLPSVPEEEPEGDPEPDAAPLPSTTGEHLSPLWPLSCPVNCMGRNLASCPIFSTACSQCPRRSPRSLQLLLCQTQKTI